MAVAEGTLIGVGAVIRQGIAIGLNATVGAGAVVIKDVADGQTVLGNPARPARLHGEPLPIESRLADALLPQRLRR